MPQTQPLDRVSKEVFSRFENRNRKNAERVLRTLSKLQPFYNAIHSDVGQELLNDSIVRMNEIIELIINEEAKEKDLAEFRVLRHITLEWSKKIEKYIATMKEIK